MQNRKKQQNAVGVTAFADSYPVNPAVIPPIPFPAIRKRVVIERPQPAPVMRCCPYCDATFADYTQRHNTTYCRASCRVAMSKLKKRTAITLLARLTSAPEYVAGYVAEKEGLPALENLLSQFGYHFKNEVKQWQK